MVRNRTRKAVAQARLQQIVRYMNLHAQGATAEEAAAALGLDGRRKLYYFRHAIRKQHQLILPVMADERGYRGAVTVGRRQEPTAAATDPFVMMVG